MKALVTFCGPSRDRDTGLCAYRSVSNLDQFGSGADVCPHHFTNVRMHRHRWSGHRQTRAFLNQSGG
ncbi:MAG TPA: hypothetical protein DE314_03255 [Sulfitobacter sp.]|jgi:hypothetical protein|nr:hypothetical protein [Sulfitobacter sp.]